MTGRTGGMIRLLYQFATAKHKTDLGSAEVDRRQTILSDWAGPDVEVDVAVPAQGPAQSLRMTCRRSTSADPRSVLCLAVANW